jgi:hypothetical protein
VFTVFPVNQLVIVTFEIMQRTQQIDLTLTQCEVERRAGYMFPQKLIHGCPSSAAGSNVQSEMVAQLVCLL